MNAKIAVAVLVAVLLSGCATMLSLDRPFPTQPQVPADVISKLAASEIQKLQVYVSSRVRYYDASNVMELAKKARQEEKPSISFTEKFPVLLDPPVGSAMVASAAKIIATIKTILGNRGYRITDVPCEECLIVLLDYAEYWKIEKVTFRNQRTLYSFARARFYYGGQEVAVGRSDWFKGWAEGLIPIGPKMDDIITNVAEEAINETLQVFTQRMASWKQRVSSSIQ